MKLIHTATILALSATLGACIVAPPHAPLHHTVNSGVQGSVTVNAGYVEPNYPQPAYGYAWAFNPFFGWGWRHGVNGWHRGWHNGNGHHRGGHHRR